MTHSSPSNPRSRPWRRLALLFLAAIVAVFLGALLYASVCAYTNFKCGRSLDYARYTNMMWNTAHGKFFRYGLTESYLKVHLSWSLAVVSLLFRLWDHPFLLQFLQWLALAAGALILLRTGRRLGYAWEYLLAILLFWSGYHFSQSTVLCEYHNVSTYFVLVPLLYAAIRLNRRWTWVPLVLIVGLREDAGLMVIPMLLHFAVRERWRAGYLYAALTAAYVALAVFVLFPWVNGVSLFERRTAEIQVTTWSVFWAKRLWEPRLVSLGWSLLPLLPFLRRGWKPLAAFLSLPLVVSLCSSYGRQYTLQIHYPAILTACAAAGMLEAGREAFRSASGAPAAKPLPRWASLALPVYLLAAVLVSNWARGFLPGSRNAHRLPEYRLINPDGLHALAIARREIPRRGILMVEWPLAGFVANRRDLRFTTLKQPPLPNVGVVYCSADSLPEPFLEEIRQGRMGVTYHDGQYVVAIRNASTNANPAYLQWRAGNRLP